VSADRAAAKVRRRFLQLLELRDVGCADHSVHADLSERKPARIHALIDDDPGDAEQFGGPFRRDFVFRLENESLAGLGHGCQDAVHRAQQGDRHFGRRNLAVRLRQEQPAISERAGAFQEIGCLLGLRAIGFFDLEPRLRIGHGCLHQK
jgi:hypothetical protein